MTLDKATMEAIWQSKQLVNSKEIVVWVPNAPLNGVFPLLKMRMAVRPKKKK